MQVKMQGMLVKNQLNMNQESKKLRDTQLDFSKVVNFWIRKFSKDVTLVKF